MLAVSKDGDDKRGHIVWIDGLVKNISDRGGDRPHASLKEG